MGYSLQNMVKDGKGPASFTGASPAQPKSAAAGKNRDRKFSGRCGGAERGGGGAGGVEQADLQRLG